MLKLATPTTKNYIAPTKTIAFVAVEMVRKSELRGQYLPQFTLLDASKKPIIIGDPSALPQQPPRVTAAQQAAYKASGAVAGQTPDQDESQRWIPAVEAMFGLTGLSVV